MSDLSAESIAAALITQRLGRPVLYFPRTGSTNDVAHAEAATGALDGLLVIADEQTAGRGRLDRRWWAPPGSSLLMSLLLRPPLPPNQAGQLTMCLGLAAIEGIEAVTGLRPALKWPNDLLLNGRKLGGMLTELRLDGERLAYAVLGLGVNVNMDFEPQPGPRPPVMPVGGHRHQPFYGLGASCWIACRCWPRSWRAARRGTSRCWQASRLTPHGPPVWIRWDAGSR